jgi:hypothetical protein
MAYNNIEGMVETYTAGADLTGSQYLFVKTDGAGVQVCGDGEAAVGVLWNSPADTRAASVVRGGDPQVYAGTALAAGIDIASDAAGKAVVAATGDVVLGRTRAAAAAGDDLVMIHFFSGGNVVPA